MLDAKQSGSFPFCSWNRSGMAMWGGLHSSSVKRPSKVQENILRIRLTEEELNASDVSAKWKGLDSSAWARSELIVLFDAPFMVASLQNPR